MTAIFKLESIDFHQGIGINDTYCFFLDRSIETSQDPDTNQGQLPVAVLAPTHKFTF